MIPNYLLHCFIVSKIKKKLKYIHKTILFLYVQIVNKNSLDRIFNVNSIYNKLNKKIIK
jgi:hypothetical protein